METGQAWITGAKLNPDAVSSREPAAPLPASPADLPLEGEEAQTFASARLHAVSTLLTNLAKTARSFILYNPRNDAIRQFLTSLLESLRTTLETHGLLEIQVRPFEMALGADVVYLNRDRERSLAFRLYRDGVRCLRIHPGFGWGEILQFLQILSIRYTGVHQQEDDAVTLLWKANFSHLEVVAVEGFTMSEEDEGEDPGGRELSNGPDGLGMGARSEAPPDVLFARVDRSPLVLSAYEPPAWADVPEESIKRLREEVSEYRLPASCHGLLRHICMLLNDRDAAWRFSEVAHVFAEIRDFLLASEQLLHLEKLILMLADMATASPPSWDPWRPEAVRRVLAACGDERAVRKLLHTAAVESRVVPPELIRLMERLCRDPLKAVLDTFIEERSPAARAFARQLIEHFGRDRVDELRTRFAEVPGTMACDLLRAIAHFDLEGSASFIAQQCWHADPDVQDEALRHIEDMPYSGALGRYLFEAVRRVDPARRLKVFRLILRSKDSRFVERLAQHVEKMGDALPPAESEQFGRVMGRLGGAAYLPLWKGWLKPAGWLRKALPGPVSRQIAASAAIGEIPGEQAAEALDEAAACAAGTSTIEWIQRAVGRRESAAERRAGA